MPNKLAGNRRPRFEFGQVPINLDFSYNFIIENVILKLSKAIASLRRGLGRKCFMRSFKAWHLLNSLRIYSLSKDGLKGETIICYVGFRILKINLSID